MTQRVLKSGLRLLAALSAILLLAGCSDTQQIPEKPKEKDITAEERKAKRGEE